MPSLITTARRWKTPVRFLALAGLVLSLALHSVQPPLHAALGVLFVLTAEVHLLANARWARTVGRRARSGLPRRVATDAALDALLILLVAAVTATGIGALPQMTAPGRPDGIAHVHGHVIIALGVVVCLHLLRHRRQLMPRPGRRRTSA